MITDTDEQIVWPVAWVDVIGLARGEEAVYRGGSWGSLIGTAEEVAFSVQGQRTDLVLDEIRPFRKA